MLGIAACTIEVPATDEAGSTTDPGGSTSAGPSESSGSSESSDASDASDASESSGSDEMLFLVPTDVGGHMCDPFLQDCPDGEKCVPYASDGAVWDANKCVPILGDGQVGEPCTWDGIVAATDSCGADSICWDVEEVEGEQIGECIGLCTGSLDAPSCPDDYLCIIANDDSVTVCMPQCDPLAPDCPEGTQCMWQGEGYSCVYSSGGSGAGAPCSQIADCDQGFICVDGQYVPDCLDSACCTAHCSLAAPRCPWPAATCVPLFESDPPPGFEDAGVCLVL